MLGYHIRRISNDTEDAYCLCDPEGNVVPHQAMTSLQSSSQTLPTFTVEFQAGEAGLQVIDEREDA